MDKKISDDLETKCLDGSDDSTSVKSGNRMRMKRGEGSLWQKFIWPEKC